MTSKVAAFVVAAAAGFSAVACTTVGPGETAVMVDSFGAPEVQGCQGPETWEFTPFEDGYLYPSRQISWDATGVDGAEAQPTKVVSNAKAPAELTVPYIITMDLTANCDDLKEFYREFAVKFDQSGTSPKGWVDLLRYVIGQPAENVVVSVAQKYEWRQIWNDESIRVEFQNALREALPGVSKARTNGKEYFTNFQVTVMKPDVIDSNLKAAITEEQNAVAKANAAQKGAEAEVEAAKAKTRVAEEQAKQRAAEVAGFPDADAYLRSKAIDAGLNPFQPVIVPGMPPK